MTQQPVVQDAVPAARPPWRLRWPLALALLLLAPVCAEYVSGYDASTGDLLTLLTGLLVIAPLYGAPALLVRDLARRRGLGWPGVLLLAAAVGVVEAGVIDQSLFSSSYRAIDWWADAFGTTLVQPLGVSAYFALTFVLGHVLWTVTIPIALVEGLAPRWSRSPWLGRPGLVVCALLYVAAAALILSEHLRTEDDHASTGQVAGAALVAAALVIAALVTGGRRPDRRRASARRPPRLPAVAAVGLVAGLVGNLVPWTWPGVTLLVAVVAGVAVAAVTWSRRPGWNDRHVVALGTGALVSLALTGVLNEPIGDVPTAAKYAHNVVAAVSVAALGTWVCRRPAVTAAPRAG